MKLFRRTESEEEIRHDAALDDLRRKIDEASLPPAVATIAGQELDTLARMDPSVAEYTIGLTYVGYLASLPWNRKTDDNLDIERAERILNENHYGLIKTKERILEHLAVKVLKRDRKPHVLVIDDEEVARRNLEHVLAKEHYAVQTASDGDEALRKAESSEFDVVVTDLRMGPVNGMQVLSRIKRKYPNTQVIVITGYATIPSAVEAVKMGAFSYIPKPFKLEKVRESVRQALDRSSRSQITKGSVLCFAGPPGTGKTSLGRSIARALGRQCTRISLGGMKDEAEIRGHRRTYVGAKPGRIIEEIRRLETMNPVIMLDELDKIGRDFKGDPESALLEVLDPEQNRAFVDHYLDVPFDLSAVMFILTANVLEHIPAPLRDRMEIIEFTGYTLEEKEQIAERFLIPKQIREKGVSEHPPMFPRQTVGRIIQEYTHEAGIRDLERNIATICRKIAREVVNGKAGRTGKAAIKPESLEQSLGKRKHRFEVVRDQDRIGVTTSLVWTEAGGDIIFVEAAMMKGKKELIITGLLGEVMRESAQAALSYIRSHADAFAVAEDFFEHHDIHIHVPSGAVQKDGPSAGLAIVLALISLLTKKPARTDVAMTGEITLTGRILPVGRIKEKILAAHRAQVKTVILPEKNRSDLEELTDDIKKDITVSLVEDVQEAVGLIFPKEARERPPRTRRS